MAAAKKGTPRKRAAKRSPKKPAAKPAELDKCLVLMPFSDPFDLYYSAIFKPAISKANLKPIRADDLFRSTPIVGDLWEMIQGAKVLLAELTTKNANVFYELGLAHAIGKPVVLVSETIDDVPFDLQQLRVILYDKNNPDWGQKLQEDITRSLTETLDRPVEAVPSIFRKTVPSQAPEQDAMVARLETMEGQIRSLSRDARRPTIRKPWERDLDAVNGPDDLEKWIRRWRTKHVPMSILRRSAAMADNIPYSKGELLARDFGE